MLIFKLILCDNSLYSQGSTRTMLAMLKTQKVFSVISYYQNENNSGASKIFQFIITIFTVEVICIFKHYLFCITLIQVIMCDICAIACLYECTYICSYSICLWRPQNNGVPFLKKNIFTLGIAWVGWVEISRYSSVAPAPCSYLKILSCFSCILLIFEYYRMHYHGWILQVFP